MLAIVKTIMLDLEEEQEFKTLRGAKCAVCWIIGWAGTLILRGLLLSIGVVLPF